MHLKEGVYLASCGNLGTAKLVQLVRCSARGNQRAGGGGGGVLVPGGCSHPIQRSRWVGYVPGGLHADCRHVWSKMQVFVPLVLPVL